MYVYDCDAILTIAIKNRSDKEMVQSITELMEDLKTRGINRGFQIMDNEGPTALKTTIITMDIKYHLFTQRQSQSK